MRVPAILALSLVVCCASHSNDVAVGTNVKCRQGVCALVGIEADGRVVVTGGTAGTDADGNRIFQSVGKGRDVEVTCDADHVRLVDPGTDFRDLGDGTRVDANTVNSSDGFDKVGQSGRLDHLRARSVTILAVPSGEPAFHIRDAILEGASAPIPHVFIFRTDSR